MSSLPCLSPSKAGVRLSLRVQPKASRIGPSGMHGEVLRWAVNAPAEQGKANQQLIGSIAKVLDVPRKQVSLVMGEAHRNKVVEIIGISVAEASDRIGQLLKD